MGPLAPGAGAGKFLARGLAQRRYPAGDGFGAGGLSREGRCRRFMGAAGFLMQYYFLVQHPQAVRRPLIEARRVGARGLAGSQQIKGCMGG